VNIRKEIRACKIWNHEFRQNPKF